MRFENVLFSARAQLLLGAVVTALMAVVFWVATSPPFLLGLAMLIGLPLLVCLSYGMFLITQWERLKEMGYHW